MCLLVAYSRVMRGAPLVLAANRDELRARPALPMDHLAPGVIGGRDLVAGGTWLAVNTDGVVAALTNRPPSSPVAVRPALRSRGELPLLLAAHRSAERAVEALAAQVDPADFNPCWLLVGDRRALFVLELLAGAPLTPRSLPPGLHLLENRPFGAASPKLDFVRAQLPDPPHLGGRLLQSLSQVLGDPTVPPSAEAFRSTHADWRPLATEAANVRAGPYGTRWSGLVVVPAGPRPPRLLYAEGGAGIGHFQRATF